MKGLLDPDYYRWCQQQYEAIRQRRNSFKGKPDQYQMVEVLLDRIFQQFYTNVLTNM